jgi:hypothetical protein
MMTGMRKSGSFDALGVLICLMPVSISLAIGSAMFKSQLPWNATRIAAAVALVILGTGAFIFAMVRYRRRTW